MDDFQRTSGGIRFRYTPLMLMLQREFGNIVPGRVHTGARQALDVVLANRMHNLFGSITKAGFQSASCFYPGMVEWN